MPPGGFHSQKYHDNGNSLSRREKLNVMPRYHDFGKDEHEYLKNPSLCVGEVYFKPMSNF